MAKKPSTRGLRGRTIKQRRVYNLKQAFPKKGELEKYFEEQIERIRATQKKRGAK